MHECCCCLDSIPAEVKPKLSMYLKNALKAKSALCSIIEKIEDLASGDSACKQFLGNSML